MNLLGEFECKVDAKGRILFPAGLKKQFSKKDRGEFVVNRGFEPYLVLYSTSVWNKIAKELGKLNRFIPKNQVFVRQFYNGATKLALDNSSRLLLPKKLLEYAGINKELVLFAHMDKVEIWSKKHYEKMLNNKPGDFAALAQEVMGNNMSN